MSFETWIIFSSNKDALKACREFKSDCMITCILVDSTPHNLDIFIPNQVEDQEHLNAIEERLPEPPNWLILSTQGDRGNLFKVKKFISQKLGQVKSPDVTRFGRNSFLIHTKSNAQAAMLLNIRLEDDGMVKEIKPHFNFSYAKGVIFNEDIHEMTDNEILKMCPAVV